MEGGYPGLPRSRVRATVKWGCVGSEDTLRFHTTVDQGGARSKDTLRFHKDTLRFQNSEAPRPRWMPDKRGRDIASHEFGTA
jgi:hypothetical protein